MSAPVVIAGGGLAGGAAACLLARAGREVLLLEREAGPVTKICGEFLSVEAERALRDLGLDIAALGAEPIREVRLAWGEKTVTAALPFPAWGLSRRVLDEALLIHAARLGAVIRRGQAIRSVGTEGGLTLALADGTSLRTRTLLLATGKHDLRGLRRAAPRPAPLVGFKLHLRLAAPQRRALRGGVELIWFPGGYGGLQRVEGDAANLCLLVGTTRLRRAGGDWQGLLADLCATVPHLALRLEGMEVPAERPVTISGVPYGFVHRGAEVTGLFRLGDQMGVIPSFTGDGMAIALHSARVAVSCLLAGHDAAPCHRRLRADISAQIARATLIHGAARHAPLLTLAIASLWPRSIARLAALTRVQETSPQSFFASFCSQKEDLSFTPP